MRGFFAVNYITQSLELHLFFARIMKEHSFFLKAGFVGKDTQVIRNLPFFLAGLKNGVSRQTHAYAFLCITAVQSDIPHGRQFPRRSR